MRWLLPLLVIGCTMPIEDVDGRTDALRNLDTVEAEFLVHLNEHRASNGLEPVFDDQACNTAARDYSQLMGEQNHFDHTGPDGSSPWDRMCDAAYDPACGPRTAVGENIAAGNSDARATFEQWRASPGHNRNMLDSRYRVVGIGRAEVPGSRYRFYWTNVFGGQVVDTTNMDPSNPMDPPDDPMDPPPDPMDPPPDPMDPPPDPMDPPDDPMDPPDDPIDPGDPIDPMDPDDPAVSGDTYLVGGCAAANGKPHAGAWGSFLFVIAIRRLWASAAA